MTPRSRLRLLAVVPALFGLLGVAIAALTVPFRHFWSPVPGVGAGLLMAFVGAAACRELWRAGSRSVVAVIVSGALTLSVFLFFDFLFPLVNASSEAPSIFARLWYPGTVSTIIVLTSLSARAARASLRRAV